MTSDPNAKVELGKALRAVQAAVEWWIEPKSKADVRSAKGNYSYRYATLHDLLRTLGPPMADNGLTLIQTLETVYKDSGQPFVELKTTLLHDGGGSISNTWPISAETLKSAQAAGSALTYYRRYNISTLMGIATDSDDDGRQTYPASRAPQRPQRKAVTREEAERMSHQQTRERTAEAFAQLGIKPETLTELLGHPVSTATDGELDYLRRTYVEAREEPNARAYLESLAYEAKSEREAEETPWQNEQ